MPLLIVDNDADTVEAFRMLFELEGVKPTCCTDPALAVELAEKIQPSVCVLDIGMPGIDGLQVAKEILNNPKIPQRPVMIAHTGHHRYECAAFNSGYDVYLLKASTDPDRLVELVMAHLQQRQRRKTMATIRTDLKGKITGWDGGAEHLYGWRAEEAVGRNVLDVTPTDASLEDAMAIMSKLSKGQSWFGKFRVRRRDGSEMEVFVVDRPLHDDAGDLAGIQGHSFPAE